MKIHNLEFERTFLNKILYDGYMFLYAPILYEDVIRGFVFLF